jgi:hypothetical protein
MPIIPILNIKTLPIISTSNITVVNPSTAWPNTLSYRATPPITKLIKKVTAPRRVTSCKGKAENEVIEETAYRIKEKRLQAL